MINFLNFFYVYLSHIKLLPIPSCLWGVRLRKQKLLVKKITGSWEKKWSFLKIYIYIYISTSNTKHTHGVIFVYLCIYVCWYVWICLCVSMIKKKRPSIWKEVGFMVESAVGGGSKWCNYILSKIIKLENKILKNLFLSILV